jgi:hypothetical protein
MIAKHFVRLAKHHRDNWSLLTANLCMSCHVDLFAQLAAFEIKEENLLFVCLPCRCRHSVAYQCLLPQ